MRGETPPRPEEALLPGALPPAPIGAGTAVGVAPIAGGGNPPGPTQKEPENVMTIWGKRLMGENVSVRTTYQVVGYLDVGDPPRLAVLALRGGLPHRAEHQHVVGQPEAHRHAGLDRRSDLPGRLYGADVPAAAQTQRATQLVHGRPGDTVGRGPRHRDS